jgi:hypothetical protein
MQQESTLSLDSSTRENNLESKEGKVVFPTWKSITKIVLDDYLKQASTDTSKLPERIKRIAKLLDQIRPKVMTENATFIPELAYSQIMQSGCLFSTNQDISKTDFIHGHSQLGANEFYAIFDVKSNEYTEVDPKIEEVLGIKQNQLTIAAISGLDPKCPLFHPDDVNHLIRSAIVGYLVTSLEGFEWKAHNDFYRAKFRVSTSMSTIPEIRNQEYVMIEKRVYMTHDHNSSHNFLPTQHFDRWTIYDQAEFNGISPYFSSDPIQTRFRNLFWYLFHVQLLGLSPKTLLILDERTRNDRNKAIASALNNAAKKLSNAELNYNEVQIGDCFVKTIRPKIEKAFSQWNKQTHLPTVNSDIKAVELAQKLCILPLPAEIKELILKNIA